jgi:multidrug transporter EmrE-like cation transporter
MKTAKWAIGVVFLATMFASTGQILIKTGVNASTGNPLTLINPPVMLGYCFYALSMVILVVCLKYGDLSVLYPIFAMNFVWVSAFSPYFFPADAMNPVKWAGVASIVLGVFLIGAGSQEAEDD